MSLWMATPRMPLMVRKMRVIRMMMVESRRRLWRNLLWAASCRRLAPRKDQVRKHSFAAQTQD